LSAVTVLHTTHASPPNPHALVERALQVGPEQQPVVHVDAHPVHTPDEQLSPPGQLSHALPPLPHAPPVLPGWQALPEQQPVGHDVPSHTHEPLRQRCPVTHAAPLPQLHSPAVEHESASAAVHALHVVPAAPQADSESVVHTPWVQHPAGHDVASQRQTPCAQCRPGAQGAPAPHAQVPVASQVSASKESHAKHDEPAGAHSVSERVSHVVPWQQPSGHDIASHTHWPPMHRCPATQAALPPQVHVPPVEEHPSAFVASHAMQTLPPAPHVATLGGVWQSSPVQHPSGHWQPVQTPAVHAWPDGHAAQARPAPPHCGVVLPGSQVLPLQHPPGHEAALHTHAPETHRCPCSHAGPVPHWQPPEAPQPSLLAASQPVQTQTPAMQSWPGGQGRPPAQPAPRLS
jgi:hypothetical protein